MSTPITEPGIAVAKAVDLLLLSPDIQRLTLYSPGAGHHIEANRENASTVTIELVLSASEEEHRRGGERWVFTVARDFANKDDEGCIRLLVNTDIPYTDEAVDRLADIIEAIDVPDICCAKCEEPESEHTLMVTNGVNVIRDKLCPGQTGEIDTFSP